jgi:hypothetical protein
MSLARKSCIGGKLCEYLGFIKEDEDKKQFFVDILSS